MGTSLLGTWIYPRLYDLRFYASILSKTKIVIKFINTLNISNAIMTLIAFDFDIIWNCQIKNDAKNTKLGTSQTAVNVSENNPLLVALQKRKV